MWWLRRPRRPWAAFRAGPFARDVAGALRARARALGFGRGVVFAGRAARRAAVPRFPDFERAALLEPFFAMIPPLAGVGLFPKMRRAPSGVQVLPHACPRASPTPTIARLRLSLRASGPPRGDRTALESRPMNRNKTLLAWVNETAMLCQPDRVVSCDGSEREYQAMLRLLVHAGTAQWLDSQLRPNSILVRSSPADVAR